MDNYLAIDIHIHVQPFEQVEPQTFKVFSAHHQDISAIRSIVSDPKRLLNYLDGVGVEKAVLINYTSPDVMGFTASSMEWVANFTRDHRDRLIPCGSVHPRFVADCSAEVNRLVEMGIRILKVHPAHQWIYPNQYRDDLPHQAQIYERAQAIGIPVMIHTGTSIFPFARNKYCDPIFIDDLITDFPKLKIIIAHGGRPLWMDEAFFLMRRSQNCWLDISGIPPSSLLEYFPRLAEIADRTLFGSDWPGPIVRDIGANLAAFRALPLSAEIQRKILRDNALRLLSDPFP